MKLSKQVVSLELAKKLKELGVKQESMFWWQEYKSTAEEESPARVIFGHNDYFNGKWTSAFTVAELGEMLPFLVKLDYMDVGWEGYKALKNGNWETWLHDSNGVLVGSKFYAESEADARAKLLIYLLENNLISHEHTK